MAPLAPSVADEPFRVTDEITLSQDDKARSKPLGMKRYKGFCFLTGITGKFESRGEVARVVLRGDEWHLVIKSRQSGVKAWARCVEFKF